MVKLSIVIPVYNEASTIKQVISGVKDTKIQYEKTFLRLIANKKKNYSALKFEPKLDNPTKESRGIATVRRENAPIIHKMFNHYTDIFYDVSDPNKDYISEIREQLKKDLADVLLGNIPDYLLEMTSSIKADYTYKGNKQALFLSRMVDRDPGTAPQPGDRVGFYYVKVNPEEVEERRKKDGLDTRGPLKRQNYKRKPKILEGDRLEPYEYVVSNRLDIDYEYYVENHIKKPIKELMSFLDEGLANTYDEVLDDFRAGKLQLQRKVTLDKFFRTLNYFDSGEIEAFVEEEESEED